MEQYFNRNIMQIKFYTMAFILLLCSLNTLGQVYEPIEKEAADLFISLSNNEAGYRKDFEELKAVLMKDIENEDLKRTYLTSIAAYDSLIDHFKSFEMELENISIDSTLFLLNQWYLHFSNVFYNYAEKQFFPSQKIKILLFSTSMSCYCTLKMCKNQLIDIIKLVRSNNGEYDYLTIDAYEKDDLPIKYETLFTPSVIVFNGSNEVIHKIQYDEEMINKLSAFLNDNKNKN
ncbi:MAG: hypothetical protein AUK34_03425 [Ignavibacteria bacterium CG2_30_36_16]|nr:MAG: hypothetical protein AUK34_03425 [Ignavibacteria bacterium CG2_30_36_16]